MKNNFEMILKMVLFRETIDEDNDGDITKDEFFSNALKSPFVQFILKERDTSHRRPKSRD